jgi:hypothetical protein
MNNTRITQIFKYSVKYKLSITHKKLVIIMSVFKTIQLPDEFIEKYIAPFVNRANGYSSKAEVVKAAVRDFAAKNKIEEKIEEKKPEVSA